MRIFVLLSISMFAALSGNIVKKYYTKKTSNSLTSILIFNALHMISAAVALLLWEGIKTISSYTLIMGVLFGVSTALQGVANLKALEIGPMSYTTVIISFSMLISALSGVVFFEEKLVFLQIIGIAFMLISFVFSVKSDKTERKKSFQWLALCLIAFLCTGMIGVMQKFHQNSKYKEEINAFLIVAFIIAFLISWIAALCIRKKEKKKILQQDAYNKLSCKHIMFSLLCGIFVAVNNKLNLYLSGVMESVVFFPIVNGGGLILTTFAAVLLFKERLTIKQWWGVILGCVAILLLCNPFA